MNGIYANQGKRIKMYKKQKYEDVAGLYLGIVVGIWLDGACYLSPQFSSSSSPFLPAIRVGSFSSRSRSWVSIPIPRLLLQDHQDAAISQPSPSRDAKRLSSVVKVSVPTICEVESAVWAC
jgi:hypothetical protein